jgi:hypothetical protein
MVATYHAAGGDSDEEVALSVLKSATQASVLSAANTSNRLDYENRLLTFQAATYYAKPACLSPMICARFGYVRTLASSFERFDFLGELKGSQGKPLVVWVPKELFVERLELFTFLVLG